jgi:signal transduction histidine kinase
MASSTELRRPRLIAARLREQSEAIQVEWLARLKQEVSAARQQSDPALRDSIPKMLDRLAEELEHEYEHGRDVSARWDLFTRHAEARIDFSTYGADEFIREYAVLRKVLFAVLEERAPLSTSERDWILDFIEEGLQVGAARFTELQRVNERLEMQYLKLIERLVAESSGEAGMEAAVQRLLQVIANDLEAEAAAFFLQHPETLDVSLIASAAEATSLAELYRGALALSVVRRPQGEPKEAVELTDVLSLPPEGRDALVALGVSQLVLVRVVSPGDLRSTLCLCLRERRALDRAEHRMLQTLGDRLALLVASLQLQEQSRAALERVRRQFDMIEVERNSLEEERRRRDELITAISHDLKNPLQTAKLGAELIRKGSGTPEATGRLADRILSSISRSDRMVGDLLDSQRIRAGKRLQLDVVQYRMKDLVDVVVGDLTTIYGPRFVVRAEEEVFGFWSWDQMRRAIENLLTNAVKYSPADSRITITLSSGGGKSMQLAVHNEGPPLSAEDKVRIFRPFERGSSARQSRQHGWGIGLTLVQGIVDAHGGKVEVESTADGGTTFKIVNPIDSRPHQASELS